MKEGLTNNTRKIVFACIFLGVVAIVATVIAITAANRGAEMNAGKNSGSSAMTSTLTSPIAGNSASTSAGKSASAGSSSPKSSAGSSGNASPSNSASGSGTQSSQPASPTVKEIAFVLPVENGEVMKEYTAASVVYNKTLGVYTGHMALDIGGAENAKVFAAYDGTIESIVTTYLEGTSVTVNHGNGLKTVYNSIEVADGMDVGRVLSKGEVIGTISTNNRQEYKDGPHLHFEVWENGSKISPYKYLTVDEK